MSEFLKETSSWQGSLPEVISSHKHHSKRPAATYERLKWEETGPRRISEWSSLEQEYFITALFECCANLARTGMEAERKAKCTALLAPVAAIKIAMSLLSHCQNYLLSTCVHFLYSTLYKGVEEVVGHFGGSNAIFWGPVTLMSVEIYCRNCGEYLVTFSFDITTH